MKTTTTNQLKIKLKKKIERARKTKQTKITRYSNFFSFGSCLMSMSLWTLSQHLTSVFDNCNAYNYMYVHNYIVLLSNSYNFSINLFIGAVQST